MEKEVKLNRVMIFIDGSNYYHGLKDYGYLKTDFRALTQKLSTGSRLIKVFYYNAPIHQQDNPERYAKQQRFFNYIGSIPRFEFRPGRLEKRKHRISDELYSRIQDIHPQQVLEYYVEKGVDVNLAIDMIENAYIDSYDKAILVAGDGDYISAIKSVQNMGKQVVNAYFWFKEERDGVIKKRKGYHLRKKCDDFIELNRNYLGAIVH